VDIAVEEIVEKLRRQIAQRRSDGDYPLGLEAELEAEFDGVLAAMRRHEVGTSALVERVTALRTQVDEIGVGTATTSNIPGGALIHKVVGRVVGRQTNGLAADVRLAGHEAAAAMAEVIRLFDAQRQADERQLVEVVSSVIDRLAVIDQLISAVNQIERRLDAIEVSAPSSSRSNDD